jgi:hypothetical protein
MKTTIPQFVLRAGLLGAALSIATAPLFAAPRDRRDRQEDRRDVAEARRDLERERRDYDRANGPRERREEARDVAEARRRLERERRDRDRRDDRPGNRPGYRPGNGNNGNWNRPGNRPGYNGGYRPGNGNNGNWNRPGTRPGYGNGGYNNGSQQFTGVVTNVRSDQSFDIRVGGTTYNVYSNSRLSRRLNEGDTVRVYGVRTDGNDIRNASVSLLSNRR